jgi:hypothetical protein
MDSSINQKPGNRRTKKNYVYNDDLYSAQYANQKITSQNFLFIFDHVYFRLGFRVTVKHPFCDFSRLLLEHAVMDSDGYKDEYEEDDIPHRQQGI